MKRLYKIIKQVLRCTRLVSRTCSDMLINFWYVLDYCKKSLCLPICKFYAVVLVKKTALCTIFEKGTFSL